MLAFMDRSVYPAEPVYHQQIEDSGDPHLHPPVMEELKAEARARGLWNLFLPHKTQWTDGLSNLDYAPLAEIMGRSPPRVARRATARPPTPGTWRSSPCSARPSSRSSGCTRCSRARSARRSR